MGRCLKSVREQADYQPRGGAHSPAIAIASMAMLASSPNEYRRQESCFGVSAIQRAPFNLQDVEQVMVTPCSQDARGNALIESGSIVARWARGVASVRLFFLATGKAAKGRQQADSRERVHARFALFSPVRLLYKRHRFGLCRYFTNLRTSPGAIVLITSARGLRLSCIRRARQPSGIAFETSVTASSRGVAAAHSSSLPRSVVTRTK